MGTHPTSFLIGDVGEVAPGAEFVVADELAGRFTTRGDVETVQEVSAASTRKKIKTVTKRVSEAPVDAQTGHEES